MKDKKISNKIKTLKRRKPLNAFKEILHEHVKYKNQIFKLAKADLIKTYKGAALGWIWAIVKPAVTIAVFYFAFSVGLRHGKPVAGYPYFLWLIAGMMPWFFMRDTLTAGAGSIRKYKYLVTKIKFPISTIPTYVCLSNISVSICLILIMLVIYLGYGIKPDIYWLQIPFYMILMLLFFISWSLFAGMLSAISKDFLNLVKAMTTALFWMSGIMYDVNGIQIEIVRKIMLFNPITLICNGFRNSLVYKQWFWETGVEMRNFLILYVVMSMLAIWAYKKLKKDVPDVL